MSIRISDEFRYWEKFFVQKFCKIDFHFYSYCKNICHKNVLEKTVLEKKLYDILSTLSEFKANKSYFDEELSVAYQILTVLVLETGSLLPDQLKNNTLRVLEQEYDMIHKWDSTKILIRKWYLNDFKRKIISHERGKMHHFISLKVNNDIEFGTSIFGLKALKGAKNNSNISFINLDNCDLLQIPQEIVNFKRLEGLSLSYNNLSNLNFDFSRLEFLKILILNDNLVESMPDSFFNLNMLEELHMSFNSLEHLPESIKNLSRLRILNLFNNRLKSLPKSITELKMLEEINISFNNISELPENIYSLKNLRIFSLNNHEYNNCS